MYKSIFINFCTLRFVINFHLNIFFLFSVISLDYKLCKFYLLSALRFIFFVVLDFIFCEQNSALIKHFRSLSSMPASQTPFEELSAFPYFPHFFSSLHPHTQTHAYNINILKLCRIANWQERSTRSLWANPNYNWRWHLLLVNCAARFAARKTMKINDRLRRTAGWTS